MKEQNTEKKAVKRLEYLIEEAKKGNFVLNSIMPEHKNVNYDHEGNETVYAKL